MMLRQGILVSDNFGAQVSVETPKAIDFMLESTALFRTLPLKAQSLALASPQTAGLAATLFTPETVSK